MESFDDIVDEIPVTGRKHHEQIIMENAVSNQRHITKKLSDLPRLTGEKQRSAIIISAGPSIKQKNIVERIKKAGYRGSIIAVDGSYSACLKGGLIPDYVMTMDPHNKRVVRWFGDHDFEINSENDDYFKRQDLDEQFRSQSLLENKRLIEMVNISGCHTKAVVSTTSPANVVQRLQEARFDCYWWNPLMDDPGDSTGLTRKLYHKNPVPCINTGGNVGTAAWVFVATTLQIPAIGLTGMDYGYYINTPYDRTQTYYELALRNGGFAGLEKYFKEFAYPLTKEKFYTDPTYYWYRRNFLELLEKSPDNIQTYNCTDGGTLYGPNLKCVMFDDFLKMFEG